MFAPPPTERVADWLGRLVRIPSVNPLQAGPRAGVPGEAAISDAVAAWLAELGGEVQRETVSRGRDNVYAFFPGREDRWVAVDTHLDTVGVEQMTTEPFSGEVRAGRVWGRGAVDTKPTLAILLALLEAARAAGARPMPSLLVTATVDEEVTATGAPAFAAWVRRQGLRLEQLAVAEPTRCGPVVAHKGGLRIGFTVHGRPAHSSQPHLGANAIVAAAHVILALQAEHERLQAGPATTPLGPGTLTVTLINGGTGTNVVPDRCAINTDRRLVPGETPAETAAHLCAVAKAASPLPVEPEVWIQLDPFLQDADAPWIRQLAEWSGREPGFAPYCTNAWAYAGLAAETVVMGPGSIDQAHGVEEWVELSELEKMTGLYHRWLFAD